MILGRFLVEFDPVLGWIWDPRYTNSKLRRWFVVTPSGGMFRIQPSWMHSSVVLMVVSMTWYLQIYKKTQCVKRHASLKPQIILYWLHLTSTLWCTALDNRISQKEATWRTTRISSPREVIWKETGQSPCVLVCMFHQVHWKPPKQNF